MKYITLCYLGCAFILSNMVGANANAQSLDSLGNISVYALQKEAVMISKGTPLDEALNSIGSKFGVSVMYRSDVVKGKNVLEAFPLPETLSKAFSKTLKGHRLTFKHTSDKTYSVYAKTSKKAAARQQETVSGTVTDASKGQTLPGVNIKVKGTTTGTSTNGKGHYSLQVSSLQDTLVFSYIGYRKRVVAINGRTTINIALKSQVVAGQEMVVVGYGKQKAKNISSSVSSIDVEKVVNHSEPDIRESLQGLSPGLTIRKNSGNPGSKNLSINIRGINTIGNTSPLILVDGVEGSLAGIDQNDVKNISVLKGPAATAIYGSRGANGVILVTTKSPQKGNLNISYNGYYGISRLAHQPPSLGLKETLKLQNTLFSNTPNGNPKYTDKQIQDYVNSNNRYKYPLPNPFWDVLFRDAPLQHHMLSFSGGSTNIQSRLALSYDGTGGIIPNSGSKKYQIKFDNNFNFNSWWHVKTKLTYRKTDNHEPYRLFRSFPSIYFQLYHWSQFTVPQYPDGTFGNSSLNTNPLRDAEMSGYDHQITDNAIANIQSIINITKGLSYTMRFGGSVDLHTNKYYANQFTSKDYFNKKETIYSSGYNKSQDYRRRHNNWTWRNLLKYQKTINKNNFNILAGYEEIKQENSFTGAYREQFYNNSITSLNGGSQNNWSNQGNLTEQRLRSVFGRIHYVYDDRYIAEANFRYDGSSKFAGSKNQYSFFPSFSGGWNISNENFWKPLSSVISNFKLRGSWGKSGNNTVGLYQFFPSLSKTTYTFNGNLVDGYSKTSLANKDLSWETTTQTDIGLDAGLWKNKIVLNFDYYWKQTKEILLTLPIPATVGLNPSPQNAGQVNNNGWEISGTYKDRINKDFNFSISANLSNNHNKVESLAQSGPYTGFTVTKVGEPLESYWGYKISGFFQNKEEIKNNPTYAGKEDTYPGDLKYVDLNEDGKIGSGDKTVIGNHFPHYQFGLNFSANYKDFDLSFFIQGVGKMNDEVAGPPILCGAFHGIILKKCQDYWTPNNRHARMPRPQKNSHKNFQHSTWWTINAAYVRLRNLQFGYTLPLELMNKVGIQELRFYVSGSNLVTFSNSLDWGFGPENPNNSNANGYYPGTSNFTFGINLKF